MARRHLYWLITSWYYVDLIVFFVDQKGLFVLNIDLIVFFRLNSSLRTTGPLVGETFFDSFTRDKVRSHSAKDIFNYKLRHFRNVKTFIFKVFSNLLYFIYYQERYFPTCLSSQANTRRVWIWPGHSFRAPSNAYPSFEKPKAAYTRQSLGRSCANPRVNLCWPRGVNGPRLIFTFDSSRLKLQQ